MPRPETPLRAERRRRGGALLAVLWLSVALATIALAVATRVRAETERSITLTDGLRARYLAEGAIHRATIAYLQRQLSMPATQRLDFPDGTALVEVVPEASREITSSPVERRVTV